MTLRTTLVFTLATCGFASADDATLWSFRPPTRPSVPVVRDAASANNAIDAFVQTKLDAAGLRPAPEADATTLLRRVHFDLTGLPPTPNEISAFLDDREPGAYERVVDRLLASPHFGERWAQHWLDAVRFGESNGYELDAERPQAWRYRDYVVRSFNADKGYDRFVTEQIAGDELAAGTPAREVSDLWIATGMHRCGPSHVVSGNLDKAAVRQENLTEIVNGIGSAILGVTMACARCHDHKFDPLPQADYYKLQAFFAGAQYADVDIADPADVKAHGALAKEIEARTAPIKKQVEQIEVPHRAKLRDAKKAALPDAMREAVATDSKKRTPEQTRLFKDAQVLIKVSWDEVLAALPPDEKAKRADLRAKIREIEAELPPPPAKAWALKSDFLTPKTYVLKRGDAAKRGDAVSAGFPTALTKDGPKPKTRRDLAAWLTRPDHPLTARVLVNRLWHHLFGRGLVATIHDFGTRGQPPSHPELLDWLAVEFVEHEWSIKHLVRLMVTSAAYRRSSLGPTYAADPDNKLLARMNRKRIDAEAIRDAILVAAGSFNPSLSGPGIRVPLEPEVYDLIFTEGEPDGLWPVTPDVAQHARRSLYLYAKRNVRQPLLEAFDQPDKLSPCNGRSISTFAPQALILMNAPFSRQQSQFLAQRLASLPDAERLTELYRRTLGRPPRNDERHIAEAFLAANGPLEDVCLALFNVNDFVYLP